MNQIWVVNSDGMWKCNVVRMSRMTLKMNQDCAMIWSIGSKLRGWGVPNTVLYRLSEWSHHDRWYQTLMRCLGWRSVTCGSQWKHSYVILWRFLFTSYARSSTWENLLRDDLAVMPTVCVRCCTFTIKECKIRKCNVQSRMPNFLSNFYIEEREVIHAYSDQVESKKVRFEI